jgi:hypothetical protein
MRTLSRMRWLRLGTLSKMVGCGVARVAPRFSPMLANPSTWEADAKDQILRESHRPLLRWRF